MPDSIIIRLASTEDDPDGELHGVLEWVGSGQALPFDSGRRLIELISVGPRQSDGKDRSSG